MQTENVKIACKHCGRIVIDKPADDPETNLIEMSIAEFVHDCDPKRKQALIEAIVHDVQKEGQH